MIVVKYRYKPNYNGVEALLPVFNSEFTNYTVTDEDYTEIEGNTINRYKIRTIEADTLPTKIQFGARGTNYNNALFDVYYLDATELTDAEAMFQSCDNLKSVTMSGNSKITSTVGMISSCDKIESVDLSNLTLDYLTESASTIVWTGNPVTLSLSKSLAYNTTFIDGIYGYVDTIKIDNFSMTDLNYVIQNVLTLGTGMLILLNSDIEKTDSRIDNATLTSKSWTLVIPKPFMTYKCSSSTLPTFNSGFVYYYSDTYENGNIIRTVSGESKPTSIKFVDDTNLLEIIEMNVNGLTSMSDMFSGCSNLTNIENMDSWNVNNVTTMYKMFYNCTSLKEVNTIGWNTAKVANFQYMFDGCTSLEHVYGIENWNVSGTVRMMNMLSNTAIRSLDLSKWSLRATVNMTNMLSGCKLQCLNLSNWNINDNATITGFIYSNDNLSNIHMYNCNTHTINKIVKMLENKVENSRVYVSSKTDMTKIESPETYWKVVPGDFIEKLSKGSINLFNGNFMDQKIKRVIIGDVDTFYYE